MKYLMLTHPTTMAPDPSPQSLAQMGQYAQELAESGVLVDTGGIQPPSSGLTVAYDSGEFTVTDGPFAESKEVLAGYIIVDVESLDQALAISRKFYEVMGGGSGEILQMFSGGPPEAAG